MMILLIGFAMMVVVFGTFVIWAREQARKEDLERERRRIERENMSFKKPSTNELRERLGLKPQAPKTKSAGYSSREPIASAKPVSDPHRMNDDSSSYFASQMTTMSLMTDSTPSHSSHSDTSSHSSYSSSDHSSGCSSDYGGSSYGGCDSGSSGGGFD